MRRLPLAARLAPLFVALSLALPAPAAAPVLSFSVAAHTDLALGSIAWTGREWVYDSENTGVIHAAAADWTGQRPWASFEPGGEETRCVGAPPKYWAAGVYCHTPDNRILRYAADGSRATVLAQLPSDHRSDGALAFDTVGSFGYGLLAATGGSSFEGGEVYRVARGGSTKLVARYTGPGGAENAVVAPRSFGSAGGALLLSIDLDRVTGRLLAVDRRGGVSVVADGLGTGANPIAVVAPPPTRRRAGQPRAGLYVGDTFSQNVFFAPAESLRAYVGDVVVGAEPTGEFWIVRPVGGGFEKLAVQTGLPTTDYNLESAAYVP